MTVRSVSAARITTLVGTFDRSPAYAGLAEALRLAIGDGRVGTGVRLPSERELTAALGVSRTTVTRAYAELAGTGYAEARHGSGTFTRLPGGRARLRDRALTPGTDAAIVDLTCAAVSAPPGLAAAYADAVGDLPAYLGGHGYYPHGLPELQAAIAATYDARGLPTDPAQIMVTPGALAAAAVVGRALGRRGDRVLVEQPVYPNAVEALRAGGARPVGQPVDPDGWDVPAFGRTLRELRPALTYLIPDFQNPTGLVMDDDDRARLARHLRASGTLAVVDEAHVGLTLDDQAMPAPFAAHAHDTLSLGSASKTFWGGLRLGWVRCPATRPGLMQRLTEARLALDLGTPVLEQLVLTRLLSDTALREEVLRQHRARLRAQRAVLLDGLTERLGSWRFRRPGGGLFVWCELPTASATALAEALQPRGVVVTSGPLFAVEGGLDRFVRLPWSHPAEVVQTALDHLVAAWAEVAGTDDGRAARSTRGRRTARPGPVLVA